MYFQTEHSVIVGLCKPENSVILFQANRQMDENKDHRIEERLRLSFSPDACFAALFLGDFYGMMNEPQKTLITNLFC